MAEGEIVVAVEVVTMELIAIIEGTLVERMAVVAKVVGGGGGGERRVTIAGAGGGGGEAGSRGRDTGRDGCGCEGGGGQDM